MAKGRPKGTGGSVEPRKKQKANGNSANVGFEAQLFLAGDKLRKNLEPSDYNFGSTTMLMSCKAKARLALNTC